MAFDKNIYDMKIIFVVLIGIPLIASTNFDCGGKSFHCLNSTHFMICVDLGGGVSYTVDDFVIECPPPTVCSRTNNYECEFATTTTTTTTTKPTTVLKSSVTAEKVIVDKLPWITTPEQHIELSTVNNIQETTTDAIVIPTEATVYERDLNINGSESVTLITTKKTTISDPNIITIVNESAKVPSIDTIVVTTNTSLDNLTNIMDFGSVSVSDGLIMNNNLTVKSDKISTTEKNIILEENSNKTAKRSENKSVINKNVNENEKKTVTTDVIATNAPIVQVPDTRGSSLSERSIPTTENKTDTEALSITTYILNNYDTTTEIIVTNTPYTEAEGTTISTEISTNTVTVSEGTVVTETLTNTDNLGHFSTKQVTEQIVSTTESTSESTIKLDNSTTDELFSQLNTTISNSMDIRATTENTVVNDTVNQYSASSFSVNTTAASTVASYREHNTAPDVETTPFTVSMFLNTTKGNNTETTAAEQTYDSIFIMSYNTDSENINTPETTNYISTQSDMIAADKDISIAVTGTKLVSSRTPTETTNYLPPSSINTEISYTDTSILNITININSTPIASRSSTINTTITTTQANVLPTEETASDILLQNNFTAAKPRPVTITPIIDHSLDMLDVFEINTEETLFLNETEIIGLFNKSESIVLINHIDSLHAEKQLTNLTDTTQTNDTGQIELNANILQSQLEPISTKTNIELSTGAPNAKQDNTAVNKLQPETEQKSVVLIESQYTTEQNNAGPSVKPINIAQLTDSTLMVDADVTTMRGVITHTENSMDTELSISTQTVIQGMTELNTPEQVEGIESPASKTTVPQKTAANNEQSTVIPNEESTVQSNIAPTKSSDSTEYSSTGINIVNIEQNIATVYESQANADQYTTVSTTYNEISATRLPESQRNTKIIYINEASNKHSIAGRNEMEANTDQSIHAVTESQDNINQVTATTDSIVLITTATTESSAFIAQRYTGQTDSQINIEQDISTNPTGITTISNLPGYTEQNIELSTTLTYSERETNGSQPAETNFGNTRPKHADIDGKTSAQTVERNESLKISKNGTQKAHTTDSTASSQGITGMSAVQRAFDLTSAQATTQQSAFDVTAEKATSPQGASDVNVAQGTPQQGVFDVNAAQTTLQQGAPDVNSAQTTLQSASDVNVAQATPQQGASDVYVTQATSQQDAPNVNSAQTTPQGASDVNVAQATPQQDASDVYFTQAPSQQGAPDVNASQTTPQGASDVNVAHFTSQQGAFDVNVTQATSKQGVLEVNSAQTTPQGASDVNIAQAAPQQDASDVYFTKALSQQGASDVYVTQATSQQGVSGVNSAQTTLEGAPEINVAEATPKQDASYLNGAQTKPRLGASNVYVAQATLQQGASDVNVAHSISQQGASDKYVAQATLQEGASDVNAAQATPQQGASDQTAAQATSQLIAFGVNALQTTLQHGVPDANTAQATPQQGIFYVNAAQTTPQKGAPDANASQTTPQEGASAVSAAQVIPQQSGFDLNAAQTTSQQSASDVNAAEAIPQQGPSDVTTAKDTSPQGAPDVNASQATQQKSTFDQTSAQAISQLGAFDVNASQTSPQQGVSDVNASHDTPQQGASGVNASQISPQEAALNISGSVLYIKNGTVTISQEHLDSTTVLSSTKSLISVDGPILKATTSLSYNFKNAGTPQYNKTKLKSANPKDDEINLIKDSDSNQMSKSDYDITTVSTVSSQDNFSIVTLMDSSYIVTAATFIEKVVLATNSASSANANTETVAGTLLSDNKDYNIVPVTMLNTIKLSDNDQQNSQSTDSYKVSQDLIQIGDLSTITPLPIDNIRYVTTAPYIAATYTLTTPPNLVAPILTTTTKITNKEGTTVTTITKGSTTSSTTIYKSSKPRFECQDRPSGRYADNDDCSKFYICSNTAQTNVGSCPVNTVFSDIKKQCTRNLSHCIRNNEFKCTSTGRFADYLKPNVYYICMSKDHSFLRFKLQCQNSYLLNRLTVTCYKNFEIPSSQSTSNDNSLSTSEKLPYEEPVKKARKEKEVDDFECEEEGRFADPYNCRGYYICKLKNRSEETYRRKHKKCDSDEVFHREKKRCVDADSSYECRYCDSLTPNIYYVRIMKGEHFLTYKLACRNDYHLNNKTVMCERKPESKKEPKSQEMSKKSSEDVSEKENDSERSERRDSFECEEEGKFTDPNDCRRYYLCQEKHSHDSERTFRRKQKKCGRHQVFNKDKQRCIYSRNNRCL